LESEGSSTSTTPSNMKPATLGLYDRPYRACSYTWMQPTAGQASMTTSFELPYQTPRVPRSGRTGRLSCPHCHLLLSGSLGVNITLLLAPTLSQTSSSRTLATNTGTPKVYWYSRRAAIMPKQGLRYAAKVDLKKEAYNQPQLHVCPPIEAARSGDRS